MDENNFWQLIYQSKHGASSCKDQYETLKDLLQTLTIEEILDFDHIMHARLIEAFRWDVWAIIYIIKLEFSDDIFKDFRAWMISKGREFYESVLNSPDDAADKIDENEDIEFRDIIYSAWDAYELKAQDIIPKSKLRDPSTPKGRRWKEDDLEKLFPKLCKKFWKDVVW